MARLATGARQTEEGGGRSGSSLRALQTGGSATAQHAQGLDARKWSGGMGLDPTCTTAVMPDRLQNLIGMGLAMLKRPDADPASSESCDLGRAASADFILLCLRCIGGVGGGVGHRSRPCHP